MEFHVLLGGQGVLVGLDLRVEIDAASFALPCLELSTVTLRLHVRGLDFPDEPFDLFFRRRVAMLGVGPLTDKLLNGDGLTTVLFTRERVDVLPIPLGGIRRYSTLTFKLFKNR